VVRIVTPMMEAQIRAETSDDLVGRPTCIRCLRPVVSCYCAFVPRIEPRLRFVVVQHPRERRHPFGTLRLARLALADLEVHVASRDASGRTRCPPCAPPGAALLYPSADAIDVADLPVAPPALVVLDGTWFTARKLVRDNAWLRALPRVRVTPPRAGRYRIRRAPDPSRQLATIEAIAFALKALEPDTAGVGELLDAFEAMIDRQLQLDGRRDPPR
jgi:DTW domain-containing protein YfiP